MPITAANKCNPAVLTGASYVDDFFFFGGNEASVEFSTGKFFLEGRAERKDISRKNRGKVNNPDPAIADATSGLRPITNDSYKRNISQITRIFDLENRERGGGGRNQILDSSSKYIKFLVRGEKERDGERKKLISTSCLPFPENFSSKCQSSSQAKIRTRVICIS